MENTISFMYSLMKKHNEDWEKVFKDYELLRKPNGDAVQDLSLLNYIVMRDKVADPTFQLQQKVERRIAELYPGKYFPMYSMVSFSDIEYQVALKQGKEQDEMIQNLIKKNNINNDTNIQNIDELIHNFFGEKTVTKN